MDSVLTTLTSFLTTYGLKVLGAVALLLICWKLIGVLIGILKKSHAFQKIDEGARGFITTCLSVVLKVLLVLTVAASLGVPMTNVAAVIASCGLAVGLALQGSLSNFAGGVMLLVFHPFHIGDYIEANGKEGSVKEISLMATRLTTPDNKDVIVPNGTMISSIITNFSSQKTRRVDLDFAVSYDSDEEKVRKVLLLMAEKHELVLQDPTPFARLTKQGESALIFTLRVWCKNEDYWTVRLDLLEQIHAAFQKVEIQIPFNQLDVHLQQK